MDTPELLKLTEKISNGTASDEEVRLYNAFYNSFQKENQHWDGQLLGEQADVDQELSGRIQTAIKKPINPHRRLWPRIAAAASITLALSVGGYFLMHKQSQQQTAQNQTHDIAPGGNKAILTLANGKKIVLTDARNGNLANESNTAINKTANGQVVYKNIADDGAGLAYNTMATPRGGQYTLILSDGTKVILNAASSIRYPANFTGNERKVEMTGEAYFEVAHNAAKPFRVISNGQTVEVLGTHFNVNAYSDEKAMVTTLLAGKVKVSQNGIKYLAPGQESVNDGSLISVRKANTDAAIAWKNGDFVFDNEPLESIMRKISLWYDVEIDYAAGAPKDFKIGGFISRNKPVSAVLERMQMTGKVKFKIEYRKITVFP